MQFRVRRDAGTLAFEGVVRDGVGAGTFTFQADPGFPGAARQTRLRASERCRTIPAGALRHWLRLPRRAGETGLRQAADIRSGAGRSTRRAGHLSSRDGHARVPTGSLDPLITLRDHGVTLLYVKELADEGYKGLAADDLREARDHGITPDYVRGMRESGYASLPMPELIKARDHGVTAEFARQLSDAGTASCRSTSCCACAITASRRSTCAN